MIEIAHRGVHGLLNGRLVLENSLQSFEWAASVAEAVEFDVWMTKDHQAVVLHDQHTGNMCEHNIDVCQTLYADLPRLKDGSAILKAEQVMEICTRLEMHVEIKDQRADMWAQKLRHPSVVVSSFHEHIVKSITHQPTLLLMHKPSALRTSFNPTYVGLNINLLDHPDILPWLDWPHHWYTVNTSNQKSMAHQIKARGIYTDQLEACSHFYT